MFRKHTESIQAGPGGGSDAKPVGTVFIGLAGPTGTTGLRQFNPYDRETFKQATANQALEMLCRVLLGRTSSMSSQKHPITMAAVVAQLCPQCALCCNGVLFKDVELQPGDSAARLKTLGLPVSEKRVAKFPQPCAALEGCSCRVYADRPTRCRDFECASLKSVAVGKTGVAGALRVIRDAQKRAEKVRRLLRAPGD